MVYLSYPNAFIGYPYTTGFPLNACGNDRLYRKPLSVSYPTEICYSLTLTV